MFRPFLFFGLLTQSLITFYWKREEVLPSNNKLNLPSNIAKKLLNNPRSNFPCGVKIDHLGHSVIRRSILNYAFYKAAFFVVF
jgi:hypothetical protein